MNNSLNRFELERKHPVRTFEIWINPDGNMRGFEMFHVSYPDSTKGYAITHNCFGQTACFCIVTNDKRITRADAIHFSTSLALNKIKAFRISLDEINGDKREC